ncbi:hypothetical protein IV203_006397 [Nitzschia inconspicua]|uniref:Uncharacterized protein n=1 Tax=Nitzschia inconspicua TaxID=303405 RepID=A0A9K3KA22_9STRA|nr:hypothetical protein IV203_006397 [Nitzschia inconspicua]
MKSFALHHPDENHLPAGGQSSSDADPTDCCVTPITSLQQVDRGVFLLHTPGSPHPRKRFLCDSDDDDRDDRFSFDSEVSAMTTTTATKIEDDRLMLPSFDDMPSRRSKHGRYDNNSIPVLKLQARTSLSQMLRPSRIVQTDEDNHIVRSLDIPDLFLS